MRPSFARLTVTRLRYPTRDDYGTRVPDFSAKPDRLPIDRCWYEPTSSTEDADGRTAVLTGYTIDAPKGADIIATDHVLVDGIEYDVDGDPLRVPSPTGALDSVRVVVTRWEG